MSTPPTNPYAHNPDADDDSSESSGSGSSPYGPASGSGGSSTPGQFYQPSAGQSPYGHPQGQNPGQPYGQPYNAPMPYGGYEQQPGYQPQQPSYPNGMHTSSGMGWGANTSKNSLGGWALGLGIAGALCCGPVAIGGIITGNLGRKAADDGLATNRGMATTGMVIGIVGVCLWGTALMLRATTGFGQF